MAGDTSIALKCYSQLSDIYRRQGNAIESVEMALNGLTLAEQAGLTDPWYIMDVATSYDMAGNGKECIRYCRKAYKLILTENHAEAYAPVISEMAQHFLAHKEYGKTDTLISLLKAIPNHNSSKEYNFAKAAVYEARGEVDSAIVYFTRDLNCTQSPRLRQAALFHLFSINHKRGDYKQASEYAHLYMNNKQAVDEEEQREWTRNAKGMYDYQKDKEREERLIRENDAIKFRNTVILSICLISIVSIFAVHFYRKKKILEEAIDKERKLTELRQLVHDKDKEIQDAKLSLRQLEQHASELEKSLKRKKADIEKIVRMSSLSTTRISRPDIAESLEKAAREGKTMNEEQWQALASVIDAEDPMFRTKIMEHIPRASDMVIRTGYLLYIGMTNLQIETLTGCARQTVWNRISKIRFSLHI